MAVTGDLPFAELAVAEGAHILRRHSTQWKARPRPEMREEVLYRLFISFDGFLPPSGSFRRHPFAKPALNREIVERFVARPLQNFIEQLAGLRVVSVRLSAACSACSSFRQNSVALRRSVCFVDFLSHRPSPAR